MMESYVALGFILLLVAMVIWKIYHGLDNSTTDVEWFHLISSAGKDGKQYASATKVCLMVTFFTSTMLITWIVFQVNWKDRATEVIALIFGWMMFGAGVEAYSKHLRNKIDAPKKEDGKANG